MQTATLTHPTRRTANVPCIAAANQRRTRSRTQTTSADPYQGFTKEEYQELCELAALDKAGKLKYIKRELLEV